MSDLSEGNFMRAAQGERIEKLVLAILGNQGTILTTLAKMALKQSPDVDELRKCATNITYLLHELYPHHRSALQ